MSITPEQAQKITDLRRRMLENIQMGLESYHGISEDEYRDALAFIRSNRASAAAAADKVKKTRAKSLSSDKALETTHKSSIADNPKFAKFAKMNLD